MTLDKYLGIGGRCVDGAKRKHSGEIEANTTGRVSMSK